METVRSADGTEIAFDRAGSGAPVIFVVGAFNERPTAAPVAKLLEPHFTTYTYDRRGRGDSGDTLPYSIDREVDDLAALIEAAGGSAALFGFSSGAVLALTGPRPWLLRPGTISREEIEAIAGEIEVGPIQFEGSHPSPGLHEKHYSPITPLFLVDGDRLPERGRGAYLWLTQPLPAGHSQQMPADAADYAAALYEILHRLDDRGFDWIAVERPPEWPEWAGVLDRLDRASSRI